MQEHTRDTIREAILRELLRGGQVYFLHNEVDTIERAAENIRNLVPEARVIVAHGQMRERELEQVMQQFYHKNTMSWCARLLLRPGLMCRMPIPLLLNGQTSSVLHSYTSCVVGLGVRITRPMPIC